MRRPRVSVVIPTHNRAAYLARCLESLTTVTVDCEIVVVDNASTDETPALLADWAARDRRLRVVRQERLIDPVANHNRALAAARGEYLCFLGDDDLVLPGNFERKVALLDAHPDIGLVYSLWRRIDATGRDLGVCWWPGLLPHSYIGGRPEFWDLLVASYIMLQAVVFRRTLYERYGGFDEHPDLLAGSDWDLLLRYCYHTQTAFLAEPLVAVRVHPQSATEALRGRFARGRLAIWRKWLLEHEPPLVLAEDRWERLAQAFRPDLQWEFGADQATIARYLHDLAALKAAAQARLADRVQRWWVQTPEPRPAPTAPVAKPGAIVTAPADAPAASPGAGDTLPALCWTGPVFDAAGYASELRAFVRAAQAAGLDLALVEQRWSARDAGLAPDERAHLQALLARPLPPDRPYLRVWHTFPPLFQPDPKALVTIGRTMFETDGLPPEWVAASQRVDLLWVPSDFNRETFQQAGLPAERLRILPGCLEVERYGPHVAPWPLQTGRRFVFLSIFDWSPRKGWDVLLRAWGQAFHPDDDVALVLKIFASGGQTTAQIRAEIDRLLRATFGDRPLAPIFLWDGVLAESDLPRLYRAVQAFVLPTRGEGWGRPLMEAMASGLPTIATGWGGHRAFMTPENSYLLDYRLVPVPEAALTVLPTYRGQRWAEPDREQLVETLRRVVADPEAARQRGERARAEIAARFSPAAVGAILRERVAEAADRARPRRWVVGGGPRSDGRPAPQEVAAVATTPGQPAPPEGASEDRREAPAVAVCWQGEFFVAHSLALVNRELARALLRTGRVTLRVEAPTRPAGEWADDPRWAALRMALDRDLAGPVVTIRHRWPPDFSPAPGPLVLIQPWEFGRLPRHWLGPLAERVTEVWVPSSYVRRCYLESGVPAEKVWVIPNGVDPARFHPDVPPLALPTRKSVRFLFVGGTLWRKGVDLLLQAYCRAFRRDDDVCLIIKDFGQDSFYRGQGLGAEIRRLQADPSAPEIVYLTGTMAEADLPRLYTAATCLVHPYRGEGFALPVAEALACGRPVIVTRGGACDDFCPEGLTDWLPATRREIQLEWPTVGPAWVLEPDREALVERLRAVYEDPAAASRRGLAASHIIRTRLTWEVAAARALHRLLALGRAAAATPAPGETATGQPNGAPVWSGGPDLSPTDPAVRLFAEGQALLQAGDLEAAERALERALDLNPYLVAAQYLLGCVALERGRLEAALQAFEQAVADAPEVADFHNGLGVALWRAGRLAEAAAAFERALACDPQHLGAWLNRAGLAVEQGQEPVARRALERARALAPDDPRVQTLAARLA